MQSVFVQPDTEIGITQPAMYSPLPHAGYYRRIADGLPTGQCQTERRATPTIVASGSMAKTIPQPADAKMLCMKVQSDPEGRNTLSR